LVDPNTGKFKTNSFKIPKTLIVDPEKKQTLDVFVRVKGGTLKTGSKIWYTYWPKE